jgi:hypothetical protein
MDKQQRKYIEPSEQIKCARMPEVMMTLVEEIRPHFDDIVSFKEELRDKARKESEWSVLPDGFADEINERLKVNPLTQYAFKDAWSAAMAVVYQEEYKAREEGREPEFQSGLNYYATPYLLRDVSGEYTSAILPFNVKRAFHEGVHADTIYPQAVVDAVARPRTVGSAITEDVDLNDPFTNHVPAFHQMFGFGTSVQSAPYEYKNKILLLQLFGDQFSWLGTDSCVLQFWISSSDLKQQRFDQAFATLECN